MMLALYLPLTSIHLQGPPFEEKLRTPSLSFNPRIEWDSETPGLGKPEAKYTTPFLYFSWMGVGFPYFNPRRDLGF